MSQARAAGAVGVTAGSGGAAYIWPGVPLDLPAAVRFFAARGWQRSHADRKDVTGVQRADLRPRRGADRGSRGQQQRRMRPLGPGGSGRHIGI